MQGTIRSSDPVNLLYDFNSGLYQDGEPIYVIDGDVVRLLARARETNTSDLFYIILSFEAIGFIRERFVVIDNPAAFQKFIIKTGPEAIDLANQYRTQVSLIRQNAFNEISSIFIPEEEKQAEYERILTSKLLEFTREVIRKEDKLVSEKREAERRIQEEEAKESERRIQEARVREARYQRSKEALREAEREALAAGIDPYQEQVVDKERDKFYEDLSRFSREQKMWKAQMSKQPYQQSKEEKMERERAEISRRKQEEPETKQTELDENKRKQLEIHAKKMDKLFKSMERQEKKEMRDFEEKIDRENAARATRAARAASAASSSEARLEEEIIESEREAEREAERVRSDEARRIRDEQYEADLLDDRQAAHRAVLRQNEFEVMQADYERKQEEEEQLLEQEERQRAWEEQKRQLEAIQPLKANYNQSFFTEHLRDDIAALESMRRELAQIRANQQRIEWGFLTAEEIEVKYQHDKKIKEFEFAQMQQKIASQKEEANRYFNQIREKTESEKRAYQQSLLDAQERLKAIGDRDRKRQTELEVQRQAEIEAQRLSQLESQKRQAQQRQAQLDAQERQLEQELQKQMQLVEKQKQREQQEAKKQSQYDARLRAQEEAKAQEEARLREQAIARAHEAKEEKEVKEVKAPIIRSGARVVFGEAASNVEQVAKVFNPYDEKYYLDYLKDPMHRYWYNYSKRTVIPHAPVVPKPYQKISLIIYGHGMEWSNVFIRENTSNVTVLSKEKYGVSIRFHYEKELDDLINAGSRDPLRVFQRMCMNDVDTQIREDLKINNGMEYFDFHIPEIQQRIVNSRAQRCSLKNPHFQQMFHFYDVSYDPIYDLLGIYILVAEQSNGTIDIAHTRINLLENIGTRWYPVFGRRRDFGNPYLNALSDELCQLANYRKDEAVSSSFKHMLSMSDIINSLYFTEHIELIHPVCRAVIEDVHQTVKRLTRQNTIQLNDSSRRPLGIKKSKRNGKNKK